MHPHPDTIAHDLKTWPRFYEEVESGDKTFEVRKNDRDFKVGDWIELWEWNPETKKYTGRSCVREISYIMQGGSFGVDPDYAVLALHIPN